MSLQRLSLQSYFEGIREEISSINVVLLLVSLFVAIAVIVLFAILKKRKKSFKWDTRLLTYGSACIAVAFVLSFIKLFPLANGGSVTFASMLPMLAYGYMAGPIWGIIAGLAYAVLQYLQEPFFLSLPQFLFDYIFPFMALSALSGIFRTKNKHLNIYLGFALAILVRYFCHVFAGIVFWAEYAPYNPVLYSFVYNSFVFVDAIPCFILFSIPGVQKLFKRK